MESLKGDLSKISKSISDIERQITEAQSQAQTSIIPLEAQLAEIRENKRQFALKKDFESVQSCKRKEENLKFKISAQYNLTNQLKEKLTKLKQKKADIEYEIKLREDKLKRKNMILSQMDTVIENYRKTGVLKTAAVDSKISPDAVDQWYKWGKENLEETYIYFYKKITECDDYFRQLEAEKLKNRMDSVIEAYKKTGSLKEAAEMASVSFDTVEYWYGWGSRGFGEENTYFYRKIKNQI